MGNQAQAGICQNLLNDLHLIKKTTPTRNTSPGQHVVAGDILRLFDRYQKVSTTELLEKLSESSSAYRNCQLLSVSWIKGLASPLSHEYVQFIVEDKESGIRTRMIADRLDTGDHVLVGWDWASKGPPSVHHSLPLPLISLIYDDHQTRPNIYSFAKILVEVTARHPSYNLMKEMCWWYAEAVLEESYSLFGGKLKEWKCARLRYSFIVRTNILRRKALAAEAEHFEKQIVEEMEF